MSLALTILPDAEQANAAATDRLASWLTHPPTHRLMLAAGTTPRYRIDGTVEIGGLVRGKRRVIVTDTKTGQQEEHLIPRSKHILLFNGDHVSKGDQITDGPVVPHDLLEITIKEQVPLPDQPGAGTYIREVGKNVTGDDHGLFHFTQAAEQIPHLDARPRIETARRFIEQEYLRFVQEHASQPNPLRLPA